MNEKNIGKAPNKSSSDINNSHSLVLISTTQTERWKILGRQID